MTLSDARKILGLGPDEDPRPFLFEFHEARERIAELVRTSPNSTLAARYEKGLAEFDEALTAVRVSLETSAADTSAEEIQQPAFTPIPAAATPVAPAPDVSIPDVSDEPPPVPEAAKVMQAPAPAVPAAAPQPAIPLEEEPPPVPEAAKVKPTVPLENPAVVAAPVALEPVAPVRKKSRTLANLAWLFVIIVALAGGGFIYFQHQQRLNQQRVERLIFLERQGARFVENRRWPDAGKVYDEIESLSPTSPLVAEGRRSIEAGILEEQQQFIGYWTGQARAESEAGRWPEAEAAARQVLDKYPQEKEAAELLQQISSARVAREREVILLAVRTHIDNHDWQAAATAVKPLATATPESAEVKELVSQIKAGEEKAAADQARAVSLLRQAQELDNGTFNQQAVDLLREASSLAPTNPEIIEAMEKMATYGRTIHVPGDFATPAEAIAQAHENDRLILGEGTWRGPLSVSTNIEIQGAGPTKTIIQCPALDGCAITFSPTAKNVRVSGIAFRHETFTTGADRFSAALLQGGKVTFDNCRFLEASGHGLVAIEGGSATVSRSRFSENGWNGAAAIGKGSSLDIRESESIHNYGHGIETWDGATLTLLATLCESNSRTGIHADNADTSVSIENSQFTNNGEFGLVLDSAASGKITGNTFQKNHLGGLVIRANASAVSVAKNQAAQNLGPGMVLEKGISPAAYQDNKLSDNQGQPLLPDADLSVKTDP